MFRQKRAITAAEHAAVIACELNPERRDHRFATPNTSFEANLPRNPAAPACQAQPAGVSLASPLRAIEHYS